jgi:V8-like Glu-specific endopeptidase
LQGYYSNNMFVAQSNGAYYGNGTAGNGYPYPGSTASVQGIVTSISGSRVTIMQGLFSTITIDDQQALNNGTAQNLYVGRSVTAYGYWNGGTFFATSIG